MWYFQGQNYDGEPSLRKDFGEIIHTIAQTPGIQKVATTTNGYRLAKHIGEWREAGLTQLNVSVDSLDPRMFAQITGENRFQQVMSGIDRAFEVGFEQVKVNVVLMKILTTLNCPNLWRGLKLAPSNCVLLS